MHFISTYSSLKQHFKWQYESLTYFLQSETTSILFMTSLRVVSQLLQLLSLFLPLKIILILTAKHNSYRLLGYINADQVNSWLVLLTIAVVVSYFLSIAAMLLSNVINARTSSRLLEGLRLGKDECDSEEARLRAIFYKLFVGYADIALFIIGFMLLIWLDPFVFAIGIAGVGLELFVTMLILPVDRGLIGFVASAIKRNPVGYIHYLSALNFILVFLSLLIEHLFIGGLNTVTAILSLLIVRRAFRSLGVFTSNAIKLEASSDTEYFSNTLQASKPVNGD